MANVYKVLYRAAAPTISTVLYTAPSNTTTMITSLVVTNTAGTSATYTLFINDVSMATTIPIPANESIQLEPKQVIPSGQTLKGLASAATVNFHITGLEMT